jgi:hypothetical protein
MQVASESRALYQPQIPLIETSPGFKARRLGEVELGRLVLLRESAAGHGIGLRADALSARGDLAEGVLRLSGGAVRFERHRLEDTVMALEIAFVLEADPVNAAARSPRSGDLIVSAGRTATGMFVAHLWDSADGLLDTASAVIRPYGAQGETTVLPWRLVERDNRARVLFTHGTSAAPEKYEKERYLEEPPPRRTFVEDSD